VLRSELKATPGSTCLATSRQTTFSSGDNHFGGPPSGRLATGSLGRFSWGL
jgi:hypothetical protein